MMEPLNIIIESPNNNVIKLPDTNTNIFTIQNPYIHGTNSNILELLTYTDFCLMEPILTY